METIDKTPETKQYWPWVCARLLQTDGIATAEHLGRLVGLQRPGGPLDGVKIYHCEDDELAFCFADVCRTLELKNPDRTASRMEQDDLTLVVRPGQSSTAGTNGEPLEGEETITEPGFYYLLLTARTKAARAYQDWVFSDVVPSVYNTGVYLLPKPGESLEDLKARNAEAARQVPGENLAWIRKLVDDAKAAALDMIDRPELNDPNNRVEVEGVEW